MKKNDYIIFFTLYLIFLSIGVLIFKDYGIGLEENFQRASGFFWLKYILQFTELKNIASIAEIRFNEVYNLNPNLPKVSDNLSYGILFDVPVALIEILFNFKNNSANVYLRHFLSFFVLFVFRYTTLFCDMKVKRYRTSMW